MIPVQSKPDTNILLQAHDALRQALERRADAKQALDLMLQSLEPLLAPLREDVTAATGAVTETETLLRAHLEAYHAETGATKVLGVGMMKRHRSLTYEAAAALQWAQEHRLFLQLNAKAFEQFCLSQPDTMLPPSVIVGVTWKAEIDRKSL